MCGAYTVWREARAWAEYLVFNNDHRRWNPRYNAKPTQDLPVVVLDFDGTREVVWKRWGLLPQWEYDRRNARINARAETVLELPTFSDAYRKRRCLVLADGFYEWRQTWQGGVFYFSRADGRSMAFAGIWENNDKTQLGPVSSFAFLTCPASPEVEPYHDRMPVVIEPAQAGAWLNPHTDLWNLRPMLKPAPPGLLACHRVTREVSFSGDYPALIEPIAEDAETLFEAGR
jgi:putative SOS response-associated peptidase YedK